MISSSQLCSSNAHSPNSSKPHCSLRPSQAVLVVPVLILKFQTRSQLFIQHDLWSLALMHIFHHHWRTSTTIDRQGVCECTSKVATSKIFQNVIWSLAKLQKIDCNHTSKPLRKYEPSPTTILSVCSSTFMSLRFPHYSVLPLVPGLFTLCFPISFLLLENKLIRMRCFGFFVGLLTSVFSFQVSTLHQGLCLHSFVVGRAKLCW